MDKNVNPNYRAGFVAILGEPNAGKSTLTNLLVGEKVAIVSSKPQTTRQRIHGLVTDDTCQMVLVDAPGFVKSTSGLNPFLQEEFKRVKNDADVILLLLPADSSKESAVELLDMTESGSESADKSDGKSTATRVVVITKADLLGGTQTPRFFSTLIERKISFVSISSLHRATEAKAEVLQLVRDKLPLSPPLYDQDLYTTQTVREMTSEFIRESCFDHLHQEIPYGLAVKILKFDEEDPQITKIQADIYIERENHKGIVIGAKGSNLKVIGTEARGKIEKLIGNKVFLQLNVSCKPEWFLKKNWLKELGYVARD